jgi:hypothetical protein
MFTARAELFGDTEYVVIAALKKSTTTKGV